MAVAGSCSSDLIPSLGTSICRGCGPEKQKAKKKKKSELRLRVFLALKTILFETNVCHLQLVHSFEFLGLFFSK